MGSVNILESVKNNKIKNLVYITSDKCYQNFEKILDTRRMIISEVMIIILPQKHALR